MQSPSALTMPYKTETPLSGIRILLIDDEQLLAEMVKETLSHLGAECNAYNQASQAIHHLRCEEYDIILTDIYMPDVTGHDILAQAREQWPDTPVILMTGNPTLDNTLDALRYGAYDYVVKPFTFDQLEFTLRRAASYRNMALENKRYNQFLEQEVQSRTRELSEFLFHSVQSLMRALEARDPYTQGHGDRVSRMVISIAVELGISEREYEAIRLACQLHDIGKIGVPDAILLKPDKLTPEEYDIMKEHVQIGYNILKPIPHLKEVSRYVYEHHERIDGKGYPRGLADKDIHLNSKLICVAEVLDALASKRCYKPAWSLPEIIRYFTENRGTAYDANVVDALISILHRKGDELLAPYRFD